MSLLFMILRKMIQNKWLVMSLFVGILLTVALVSTIPIYYEAILSRMLVKDLEAQQIETNTYSGTYLTKISFRNESGTKRRTAISNVDEFMKSQARDSFGIPLKNLVKELQTTNIRISSDGANARETSKKQYVSIKSQSQLEEHIRLIDGRIPDAKPVNGVYEVLVNRKTMSSLDFVLGTVFQLQDEKGQLIVKVKPVGLFEKKSEDDLYFRSQQLTNFDQTFIMSEETFQSFMENSNTRLLFAWWYFVFDYSHMELRNITDFQKTDTDIRGNIASQLSQYQADITSPIVNKIEEYLIKMQQLNQLMWSLNVPVLIMLAFYMFMVSNLIIDRQKNEIAILRSRGASRLQIITSFAIEVALLCVIGRLLGPYLGMQLGKVLGASNGFLEFIQRSSLPVYINKQSNLYSTIAAIVVFVMVLIPVSLATRVSIVGHKQGISRAQKASLWHRMFLDVVLLLVSIYGLNLFRTRIRDMRSLGLSSNDLQIDPLQFVVPTLFIVGSGLMLLRLYPIIVNLIYRVGNRLWPPAWYAILIQVGRSSKQYQFLMIFFVITIATGVFSVGLARTINNNMEERILYAGGSDFVIESEWPNNKPTVRPSETFGAPTSVTSNADDKVTPLKSIQYEEPPFEPYMNLPGVEHAAKVFVKPRVNFNIGDVTGEAKLMGIQTDEFGRIAWFQDLLLKNPFNEYLNLMALDPKAVLISKTMSDQKKIKVGDTIWVGWESVDKQPFIVYGIVEYFPTFNPNPPLRSEDKKLNEINKNIKNDTTPMLIVGHISRIQLQLALEPYQTWLKMKPGFSTAELYKGIQESKIDVIGIHNTREELIKAKNDPFLMALNGILTLGFLVSILITFVGFLLYWILSLRGKTLQNGVMRALGLSLRQLINMLMIEQLLTTGVAIVIGIIVGNVTGRIFIPNFQIAFNPGSLVPPFRVVFETNDFMRLYAVVGIMLITGLMILGYMLARTRIHQALKLGED